MAVESKTAVIGFVCMDYIMARAVVYGAQAVNTPALVMLYPEHVTIQKTTGRTGYAEAVKELAGEVNVPIGLHQDHDYTIASLRKTMDAGFESIMMDGSLNDLDKNIRLTAEVVREAHARNVLVEGEIGHVGLASNVDNDKDDLFTKPDAAERFCRESGVDSLAISIGNAHGEYKQTPHLDIARLESIKAVTDVPLVLHGGSGIPDDQLAVAFAKGIRKFNLGTDFLSRYFAAAREFVNENIENPDPVKIINMPEFVQAKIQSYVEDRLRTLCRF
jgi:ketose-bisphosphate aldolase